MSAQIIKCKPLNFYHDSLRSRLDLIATEFHNFAREVESLKDSPAGLAKSLRSLGDSTFNLKSTARVLELANLTGPTKHNSPKESYTT